MKLYIIRHGESEANARDVATGWFDAHLTEKGREEARLLQDRLLGASFLHLFTSTLSRAFETAEIINQKLGLPISRHLELVERNFGTMTGTPWNQFPEKLLDEDRACEYDYRPFGGESAEDVRARLKRFLNHAQTMLGSQGVGLVVSSGGIMRLMHKDFRGEVRGRFDNGEMQIFEF